MTKLKINRLSLNNIGPFSSGSIEFKSGLNVICGKNGVGKSTILESIISGFSGFGSIVNLHKKANSDEDGVVTLNIDAEGFERETSGFIRHTDPSERESLSLFQEFSSQIISIPVGRDFSYHRNQSIQNDPQLEPYQLNQRLLTGINPSEVKQWLSNRYLLRPHAEQGGWTTSMIRNLELAISMFSVLDPDICLSRVDIRSFDIYIKTSSGEIPFEYLSSGFKSIIAIMVGLIKEIEFRRLDVSADSFSGVILIDEIDLHLHPTWQREITRVLCATFPLAQIIVTTHSPHVVQSVEVHEVLSIDTDEGGNLVIRDLPDSSYGFSGWSVEEVLTDVMGMKTIKTDVYRDTVILFDDAIERKDGKSAREQLGALDDMLHPSSLLRTLFQLRAASVAGID